PNPEGRLVPGLFTRVRLPMTAEYDALLIDDESILTDQANKYVLGVTPENTTVYKPVVIGPTIDGKRLVRSGLVAGDKVIVNGMARLHQPGMAVEPVEAPAPDAKNAENATKAESGENAAKP